MNHKGTVQLETKRLLLRRFVRGDANAVFENWASDDAVTRFLTWPTHQKPEASRAYMDFCVKGYEQRNFYQWGVELKESGTLIGNISVVHVEESINALELGWVIGRRWWGEGYTAEAARAVLSFLFAEVGARRIAAFHDVNNPNSGKVMQKIGMRYEGTLRQSARNNQGIVDCSYYSILQNEMQWDAPGEL